MNVTKSEYGTAPNGETISLYRMENASGASVTVSDYGCRIISIFVPDKTGELIDVCLGLNGCEEYLKDDASLGAVVGRCANRIANGVFTLNGQTYQLAINNGPNHLHGGPTGFATRVWNAKISGDKVIFSRFSPDGEENYPGNLNVSVTYGWSEDNELSIAYEATTDQDTVFSVTSHGYFNLSGQGSDTVLDHELHIDADQMTESDPYQCPTGKLLSVENTPFDFRKFKTIGQDFENSDPQFTICGTYDHNLLLNGSGLREAAILQSPVSGIRMTCFTDQPGIQVYVPNYVLHQKGKNNIDYPAFSSVCLETQHYPDSIHHPEFPSVVLKADETFKSKTLYHFSVVES